MALKEFEAGESIRAVETNANNKYLEGLMSEAASELRTYLENEIAQMQGNFVLTGSILAIPYDTIPVGYLKCDGSSLLREDYSELFNKIGTIYGAVDDYHFNLPDYQGVFLRGFGGNAASLGTRQDYTIQSHAHTSYPRRITWGNYGGRVQLGYDNGTAWGVDGGGNATTSTGSAETRPVNMSVIWIIKY